MRIISGKARGTKINTIDEVTTRPTLDRVRESLFNIIQNYVSNTYVLDIFAGSGALGIEALSRGAKQAVFCDINKDAVKIINENLMKTRLNESATVYNMNYKKMIEKLSKNDLKFDIVFVDPPYKENIAVNSVKLIIQNNLLNENGIVIIETDEKERDLKELQELNKIENENLRKIKIIDERKYGRANLIFLRVI